MLLELKLYFYNPKATSLLYHNLNQLSDYKFGIWNSNEDEIKMNQKLNPY